MGILMDHVVSKWLLQRVAAVILLPFLVWFLFHFDNLMTSNYSEALMFLSNKTYVGILSLVFILAFFHMRIGMGEIFEDYIHDEKVKKIASGLILLISLIIPVAAIAAMVILGL